MDGELTINREKDMDMFSVTSYMLDKEEKPEELINYISEISEENLLYAGIIELCDENGYSGGNSHKEYLDFIVARAEENHLFDYVSRKNFRQNVLNWLNGSIPDDKDNVRENVYLLCFAIMRPISTSKVENFFRKKYLCNPFNYRNLSETVYYYIINKGGNYGDARRLLDEIDKRKKQCSGSENTIDFYNELLSIEDDDEMIEYCVDNYDFFNSGRRTSILKIQWLINNIYDRADNSDEIDDRENSKDEEKKRNLKKYSAVLRKIYGNDNNGKKERIKREKAISEEDKAKKKKEYNKKKNTGIGLSKIKSLPDKISKNFPTIHTLSDIINSLDEKESGNENINYYQDAIRKALILLYFYDYFDSCSDDDPSYKEFKWNLNVLLDECGFVPCYVRNPYDWLFLFCARKFDVDLDSDDENDPITIFQYIVKEYFKIDANGF